MTIASVNHFPQCAIPRVSSRATRCVAALFVALDIIYTASPSFRNELYLTGSLLPLVALVLLLCSAPRNRQALGLRRDPVQGWLYWWRIALWFALIMFVAIATFAAIWWAITRTLPPAPRHPADLTLFINMCIDAPLTEEILYRALLAIALLPLLGYWGTILFGGILFALLHHLGGNPGIDNQIAGVLLMWAFLRSGSLLVPLAYHAAGNSIAFLAHVVAWHVYQAGS